MIKLTLLELTQDMLAVVDSENVSAVGETEESGMCVNIANRAFESMATAGRWRHFRTYISQLSTTGNTNELTLPSGCYSINLNSMYYENTANTDFEPVYYKRPDDFQHFTIIRDTSASNISDINKTPTYTDRIPQFFTSYDDETLVFDANDSGSLDGSKVRVIGWVFPTSRKAADADTFDLPARAYPALTLLCNSMALSELKGDSQEGNRVMRSHKQLLARLDKEARFIDPQDDIRQNIVPRRTRGMTSDIWQRLTP